MTEYKEKNNLQGKISDKKITKILVPLIEKKKVSTSIDNTQ